MPHVSFYFYFQQCYFTLNITRLVLIKARRNHFANKTYDVTHITVRLAATLFLHRVSTEKKKPCDPILFAPQLSKNVQCTKIQLIIADTHKNFVTVPAPPSLRFESSEMGNERKTAAPQTMMIFKHAERLPIAFLVIAKKSQGALKMGKKFQNLFTFIRKKMSQQPEVFHFRFSLAMSNV